MAINYMGTDNDEQSCTEHSVFIYVGIRQTYLIYCKSGNNRGALIFANFAQIQQARIQKPAKIFVILCMHILDT